MGQKIHPTGLRLNITHTWNSRWFAGKGYSEYLKEDQKVRKFIKKRLNAAGVSRTEIERKASQLDITIHSAKPGIIVGRGGQGIDALRKELSTQTGKKVQINIVEVPRVDMDAQLVAENVAVQLEKRIAFRRAMKQAIMRAQKSGAKGIKIMVAGRLGGAEIARTEWSREGRIPLHTLRADIDYGLAEAHTVYGIIGVKVWVYRGEVLPVRAAEKEGASLVNA